MLLIVKTTIEMVRNLTRKCDFKDTIHTKCCFIDMSGCRGVNICVVVKYEVTILLLTRVQKEK